MAQNPRSYTYTSEWLKRSKIIAVEVLMVVVVVMVLVLVVVVAGAEFMGGLGGLQPPHFWEGALKSYTPGPLSLLLFYHYFIII